MPSKTDGLDDALPVDKNIKGYGLYLIIQDWTRFPSLQIAYMILPLQAVLFNGRDPVFPVPVKGNAVDGKPGAIYKLTVPVFAVYIHQVRIIAGTNPLATDMVAAKIMGFNKNEVAQFIMAMRAGITPRSLDQVEIRGEQLEAVQMTFKRPEMVPWGEINSWYGVKEIHAST